MNHDLRSQFPILQRLVHVGKPLVYLDNAATTQKPQTVIDAIADFYATSNANAHRGGHALGAVATGLYEGARTAVAKFLHAQQESIIFTRGATESINLLAYSLERTRGAELNNRTIVVSEMEHHANIVPWQVLCERTGAKLRVISVLDDGSLDMMHARELIDDSCAVVSVMHMSNVLGTINDVRTICSWAQERGAVSIIDGSQYVVHHDVDVSAIGCDAYVFSGHKIYAPFGIGVLYGRYEFMSQLLPYQTGGAMIDVVSFDGTTYADSPIRFEAGTPNIEGAVGLHAAVMWLQSLDRGAIAEHEGRIAKQIIDGLLENPDVTIIGGSHAMNGIVSITVRDVHAHDLSVLLDEQGVAVRSGHHCAMPLMKRFGLNGTLRASVAAYTTQEDAHAFLTAFNKSCRMLGA